MKVWIKRAISLVALAVVAYLFWPLIKEIQGAAHLFRLANWIWLPVIILVQFASYAWLTWLNLLTLKPFPGQINFFRLMALLTSMAFIEVAIPSAGASGIALRARLLGKYGYNVESSTFTVVLETIFLAIAMTSIGLLGFIYLLQKGELKPIQIVGLVLLVILVASALGLTWRVLHDDQRSRRVLGWFANTWNRLFGRWRKVDEHNLDLRLAQFQAGLAHLGKVPRWKFILAAYGRVMLDVATLGGCFWMFGYPIEFGTLLTGYGLILLLSGVAALPGGLGLADASVPVIFHRLGAQGSISLAAGLTYRLLAFWLLRFIGFIAWQYLEVDKPSLKELKDAG